MNENKDYILSILQKENLSEFSFELIKQALQTEALHVSDKVKNQRLEICGGCEEYHPITKTCLQCGCFLEHKTSFALDTCPLKKWAESKEDWVNEGFDNLVTRMRMMKNEF